MVIFSLSMQIEMKITTTGWVILPIVADRKSMLAIARLRTILSSKHGEDASCQLVEA